MIVQVPVNSFSSVNIATTGLLEATLRKSKVHSLLSVNIATTGLLEVEGTQLSWCEHSNSRRSPGDSHIDSRCALAECDPNFQL